MPWLLYTYFFDFLHFDKSLLLLTVTLRGVSNKHCLLSLFSFYLSFPHLIQEGKPFNCKVLIKHAAGLPMNIDRSFCRYKVYLDDKYTQTEEVAGTINPTFHHEKKISFKSATKQVHGKICHVFSSCQSMKT